MGRRQDGMAGCVTGRIGVNLETTSDTCRSFQAGVHKGPAFFMPGRKALTPQGERLSLVNTSVKVRPGAHAGTNQPRCARPRPDAVGIREAVILFRDAHLPKRGDSPERAVRRLIHVTDQG